MKKLEVIVKTCPYSSIGSVTIENGHHIKVGIPESNQENSIQILKELSGWKVELLHTRPGFGKPYLLNLTNQEKGDKIKISIVPQRDFVKTSLMDCTFKSLKCFTLNGPNITTNKSQSDRTTSGMKLELISFGTLRISSYPLQVKDVLARVIPIEGCTEVSDIYVNTGAVMKCTTFETNVNDQVAVFINGTVTSGLSDKECLTVRVGTGDLHVNIDGVVGQEVDATIRTKNANLTKRLIVEIENGDITNFGSLCARDYLKLKCNNIMLCSDSKHDTAQRGFDSFISLQKEMGHLNDIAARPKKGSSLNDSRMLRAVQSLDCDNFISIVNEEVDPAVKIFGQSIQDEFHAVCGGRKDKDAYDKDQHKKEIIRGGLATCKWRHGLIRAAVIDCIVHQDIYDCSQMQGNNLHFDVGGSVSVIKPWTWISGTISGLVRGNFLFYDNAMLRSFKQFHVLGNVRICKTSVVWVKEGGKLYCGEVFENKNVIVSEGNFALDLGELKQDKDGGIISKRDLLLALRNGQDNIWFGYVQVEQHLFIQLEKKVSCDAECIASECDVEFFGGNAQLVINQILIVEEGDLNLEATDTCEVSNFVLFGELYAKGINGVTATVCTMPGAIVNLTCACNGEQEAHVINVFTRSLEIKFDSVMICSCPRDKQIHFIDLPVSTNVLSKELMSVHGMLQVCSTYLRIQSKSLNNSGKIELSPGIKTKSSIPSSLCITCEKTILNSGKINCNGHMSIKSRTLSNEKGVLKSSIDLVMDLGEIMQDSEGKIISDKDLWLTLRNEQEGDWYGCVQANHHLVIQLQEKVICNAECIVKECHVKFEGSNAQLVITEMLNVKEGLLILEATDTCEVSNFVLYGKLFAKGIIGITASVSTMPGAIADLTCAWNSETEAHTVDVITRCLEINADSVMICSGPRDKNSNIIDLPISTIVFSEEKMTVHGKLESFAKYLRIESKSLNNSGKIELSSISKNKSSIPSSLCITCEKNTLNSGTIKCDGDLIITSESLSNEKGVIKSSPNLGIEVSSTDETTLSGKIYVDRYLYVHSQSHKKFSFSALGGKGDISDKFVSPNKFEVICEKGHLWIDSAIVSSEENIEPECVFSLSKYLNLHKEFHFGKIFVEFHTSEDPNNAETSSAFIVEDSFHANHLSIRCVKKDAPTKEKLVFQGPNKSIAVQDLYIDKSIAEVIFNTNNVFKCSDVFLSCELATITSGLECVSLEANSIHVSGRIKCVQPTGERKSSTVTVDETFKLSGVLECVGFVEVNVEKSFVQEKTDFGGIDVLQTLTLFTGVNGLVSLGGLTTGKAKSFTSLEIEANDVNVSGSLTNLSNLKLTAEKDLHLTEEGRIFSCEKVEIKGEWITMAGSIEEFLSLQIEPWALLNTGKIESALEKSHVCLSSYLALVNSGTCKGQETSLEAPFLLSVPGKEIIDVNDVRSCELVGRERITLESITCFLGGSTLKSNKLIENNTVLLFKFLAYVSCTPDAKSLEAWSKAAKSLQNIQSQYADNERREISNSLKSLKKGCKDSAEIGLRIDQMYSMVKVFVADILKNGIGSFDVSRLVFIITSESERYTKINILKEKLLAIPHEARKLRQWMKKKGVKGIKSIMKRFGFSESKRKSNKTEGIFESGLYSLSEGVTFTDSAYEALFDELFYDEGVLAAVDVIVASKEIVMTKREKKAITMMMFADDVCKAGDITSDSLVIKSEGKAQLDGKIKSDDTTIEASSGIDIVYHDKSKGKMTADHEFKKLTLKTDKMNQVNDLLKGQGVYKDLRVSDQLDLAVTDQDIVLSRCNMDQLYKLNLKAKSVNIDNARVHCEKGVSITSDQSMNVSGSSISSRGSTILQSTEGNVSMNSSHVEASNNAAVKSDKGSISMTGGSISGDEGTFLLAKEDIVIDPIETHHSSESSESGIFSSTKDSCSYTAVSKARISSNCGNIVIASEEGSVKATTTEMIAAESIAISAKKEVVIQDKVTTRVEEHESKNWFRKNRKVKRTEEQHCSTLRAGGSLSISSQDSNVSVIGTNCQVGGDMIVNAAGTVLFKDRILSSSEQSHSSGISFSLNKGLSIGEESRRSYQQRLAGCRTDVRGNLHVSAAKKFDVKNAMDMEVGNMIINARNINFEGAELQNTSSTEQWSIDLGINQLDISVGQSRSKEKKVINQNIKVRGRTHFTNAENFNLTACNLDTDGISGNIEKLNVISKKNEIDTFSSSTSIGFTMAEGFPVPNKFGKNQSSDVGKFVEKPSGIHCRGSVNQDEFQVGSLKLSGSSFTADGAIGNFAKKIVSEKLHSYRSQSSSGFSIGVDKRGGELGMNASNKFMAMEHEATIASSSGIVSEEIKKSVNTDFSKQSRITEQHSSAFGINLKVAKDGVGAGLQTNDTSFGFCASKDKVGVNAQHGDKGFSLSGGKSGFSGSVQDGENSVGLAFSKDNVEFDVKTKDSAIGTSLGKGGLSASVEHKNLSIAASTSRGNKSFQAKVGDFEAGVTRDKNRHVKGEKSTSASLKIADVGISGTKSKHVKAIDFHVKDIKTGIKSERNSSTGKKTSARFKAGDLEVGGTKSRHSKSFELKKGDFDTAVRRDKDAHTGNNTTSARLKKGDLEVGGTTSRHSNSLDFKKGDFQTGLRQDMDADTGNNTTSARLKSGDLEVGGTTSRHSKSLDFKKGDFQTRLRRDKDADTGNNTTSVRLKSRDLEVGGTTSRNSKSLDFKKGDFETGLRQDKDADTGNNTTSARLKKGDLEVGGTTSSHSNSLDFKKGDFQTGLRQDKDADTGNNTTSARLKSGDIEVGCTTSRNSKSLDFKKGVFETGLRRDMDADTGNNTTSARLKAGDLEVGDTASRHFKSLDLKKVDIENEVSVEN